MSKNVMIKPCPFCGGEAHFEIHGQWIARVFYQEVFTGECTKCGAKGQMWTCCEDASRAWNRRPIEDAQAARIAKLEAALREIVRMSTPDHVCRNCMHCEEISGYDYCSLNHTGSPLEDASSQECEKFEVGGFIVPGTYKIARAALEKNTEKN